MRPVVCREARLRIPVAEMVEGLALSSSALQWKLLRL
jgi:hypothetical protein